MRASSKFDLGALRPDEMPRNPKAGLRPIGVRREVPSTALARAVATTSSSGSRVWRITLTSPGAAAMRVHFVNFAVGKGQVWVYAPPSEGLPPSRVGGPYSDGGLFGTGQFWSATIAGEAVIVEYDEAVGGAANLPFPPFEIDAITHRLLSGTPGALPSLPPGAGDAAAAAVDLLPADGPVPERLRDLAAGPPADTPRATSLKQGGLPAPGPCELDVSCYPSYAQLATGVALLVFVSGNNEYACSGSMVQTGNNSFQPYLLTANHCIGNAGEAQTLETFFKYQTSQCNGTPPPSGNAGPEVPTVEGAQFLAGAAIPQGDYSLNLLNSDAPAGVYFFGWTNTAPNLGEALTVIHHPAGSWARISFGNRSADETTTISGQTAPASLYYQVTYSQGVTEPGSSGSPLLNSNNQIVGTLTAGTEPTGSQTYCTLSPFIDTFGRFSNAYPAIQSYLAGGATNTITVNPSALAFTQSNTTLTGQSQQTILIQTANSPGLSFTAQAANSWVVVSLSNGTVSASAPASLTVTVNPFAHSSPGSYQSTITLTPSGGPAIAVPVWVTVTTPVSAGSGAALTVVSEPNPIVQVGIAQCPWSNHLLVQETTGLYAVTLNQLNLGGEIFTNSLQTTADGATTVGDWFGGNVVPPGGSLSTDICDSGLSVPLSLAMGVQGTDSKGNSVAAQATADYAGPASVPVSLDVEPPALQFGQDYPHGQTNLAGQVTVTLGAGNAPWTASLAYAQLPSSWLSVSPLSGNGSGTINVTANASGLAPGLYQATLFVQTPSGSPQYELVLVELQVDGPGVNAAAFTPGSVPGEELALFGANLSTGRQQASALPLLTEMQGTQVTVDGVAAPLYYVSPTQINLQIPYETPPGNVTVRVTSNGNTVLTQELYINEIAPGIYTSDGTHPVPSANARLGGYLSLYLTGQGLVSPSIANAAAPSNSLSLTALPASIAPITVLLGGDSEQVSTGAATITTGAGTTTPDCPYCFAGIPYGLVGVLQLNVLIPDDPSLLGEQPVIVEIGNVSSNVVMVNITQ